MKRKLFAHIAVKQPQVAMKLKKNLDIAIWAMDELLCSRGVANAELKNAARMDEQYISRVGEIVKVLVRKWVGEGQRDSKFQEFTSLMVWQ